MTLLEFVDGLGILQRYGEVSMHKGHDHIYLSHDFPLEEILKIDRILLTNKGFIWETEMECWSIEL